MNLNKTKTRLSSKYGLSTSPKLVDIIAAVPSQYKKLLVPKLRAKPVRTASGIAVVAVMCKPHRFLLQSTQYKNPVDNWYSYELYPQVPPHQLHGKHLCVLSWWT